MTTVASHFGHNSPRLSNEHAKLVLNNGIGIELEIEECNNLRVPMWDCKEDGSLRNGCELVCSQPYSGEALYTAIENLSEAVGRSDANGTWRCSTHVHMDMRDADSNIAKKTILSYAYYEKMLFKCSGYHRYRSNFCPAFAVVQGQVFTTASAFSHNDSGFFDMLVRNWDKYTSLNLLPLREFGSMEFRISEPKWKRTNLLNLVNRFLMLKKLAIENAAMSNAEYVEHLNTLGFAPMIPYLPLDYDPNPEDLELGYQIANDIVHVRSGVQVINQIREGLVNANGETVIATSDMGHWESYSNYARGHYRDWWDRNIRPEFGVEIRAGMFTISRMEQMIQVFRDARGTIEESNIYRLIPDGLQEDVNRYIRELGN